MSQCLAVAHFQTPNFQKPILLFDAMLLLGKQVDSVVTEPVIIYNSFFHKQLNK